MKIKIFFKSQFKKVVPEVEISTKYNIYKTLLDNDTIFEKEFNLQQKDTLKINFLNKDGVDDNIIFIESIEIDEINLQHYIYDGIFYPEYDQNWLAQQTQTPPTFYKPCTELRLKGTWHLNIQLPVWKMIMEKWLNDNR